MKTQFFSVSKWALVGTRALWIVLALAATRSTSELLSQREITSSFPTTRTSNDTDDILRHYQSYLDFVLEISKETDPATAKRLRHNTALLKKRHPEFAARFLKGLRFEMQQKLEFLGMAPEKASSRSPEIRRWVTRFVKEWDREADEYLFRAIALRDRE